MESNRAGEIASHATDAADNSFDRATDAAANELRDRYEQWRQLSPLGEMYSRPIFGLRQSHCVSLSERELV